MEEDYKISYPTIEEIEKYATMKYKSIEKEKRDEADKFLTKYENRIDMIKIHLNILAISRNAYAKTFSTSYIINLLNTRWNELLNSFITWKGAREILELIFQQSMERDIFEIKQLSSVLCRLMKILSIVEKNESSKEMYELCVLILQPNFVPTFSQLYHLNRENSGCNREFHSTMHKITNVLSFIKELIVEMSTPLKTIPASKNKKSTLTFRDSCLKEVFEFVIRIFQYLVSLHFENQLSLGLESRNVMKNQNMKFDFDHILFHYNFANCKECERLWGNSTRITLQTILSILSYNFTGKELEGGISVLGASINFPFNFEELILDLFENKEKNNCDLISFLIAAFRLNLRVIKIGNVRYSNDQINDAYRNIADIVKIFSKLSSSRRAIFKESLVYQGFLTKMLLIATIFMREINSNEESYYSEVHTFPNSFSFINNNEINGSNIKNGKFKLILENVFEFLYCIKSMHSTGELLKSSLFWYFYNEVTVFTYYCLSSFPFEQEKFFYILKFWTSLTVFLQYANFPTEYINVKEDFMETVKEKNIYEFYVFNIPIFQFEETFGKRENFEKLISYKSKEEVFEVIFCLVMKITNSMVFSVDYFVRNDEIDSIFSFKHLKCVYDLFVAIMKRGYSSKIFHHIFNLVQNSINAYFSSLKRIAESKSNPNYQEFGFGYREGNNISIMDLFDKVYDLNNQQQETLTLTQNQNEEGKNLTLEKIELVLAKLLDLISILISIDFGGTDSKKGENERKCFEVSGAIILKLIFLIEERKRLIEDFGVLNYLDLSLLRLIKQFSIQFYDLSSDINYISHLMIDSNFYSSIMANCNGFENFFLSYYNKYLISGFESESNPGNVFLDKDSFLEVLVTKIFNNFKIYKESDFLKILKKSISVLDKIFLMGEENNKEMKVLFEFSKVGKNRNLSSSSSSIINKSDESDLRGSSKFILQFLKFGMNGNKYQLILFSMEKEK